MGKEALSSPSGFFTGENRKMRFTGGGGGVGASGGSGGGGGGGGWTFAAEESTTRGSWFDRVLGAIGISRQDRSLHLQIVEAMTEEEREQLITECGGILDNPAFGEVEFKEFVLKMIKAIGGWRRSPNSEHGSFRDPQTGYVIALHQYTEGPLDMNWIDISGLRDPLMGPISGNVLVENLTWRMGFIPTMHCSVNVDLHNPLTFRSFILGERVEQSVVRCDENPRETTDLTPQIVQKACRKVFQIFENGPLRHTRRNAVDIISPYYLDGRN